MKVVITGASGFIGKHLVNRLKLNHELALIIRRDSLIDNDWVDKTKIHRYCPTQKKKLSQFLQEFQPNVVIHLATLFKSNHELDDVESLVEANITFGAVVLEALKDISVNLFINATTYATSMDGVSYKPQNLYAATKKAFEDILFYFAMNHKAKVLNLNFYDTYGNNDTRPKIINLLIAASKSGKELKMSPGDQEISLVYISDLLRGIELALNIDFEECWNHYSIHSNESLSLKSLVKLIEVELDTKLNIVFGGLPYRPREIMTFNPRYPLLPGFTPKVSLRQGIRKIAEDQN